MLLLDFILLNGRGLKQNPALSILSDFDQAHFALIGVLPAIALSLADVGKFAQDEQTYAGSLAVELYALASRHPYVADSRWFEDVAGKRIAARLPPGEVAAARKRGQARELEATAAELLVKGDLL